MAITLLEASSILRESWYAMGFEDAWAWGKRERVSMSAWALWQESAGHELCGESQQVMGFVAGVSRSWAL